MTKPQQIILIDPDMMLSVALHEQLVAAGQRPFWFGSVSVAVAEAAAGDVVILAAVEGETAVSASLTQLHQTCPHTPILLAVSPAQVEQAIDLLAAGRIHDYLLRPYHAAEVAARLRSVAQARQLQTVEQDTIETLYAVQREIVTTPDEPSVKQKIVNVLVERFGYHAAAFWVVDPDDHSGVLTLFAAQGFPPGSVRQQALAIPEGRGIVGQVFATQKPAIIPDLFNYQDELILPNLVQQLQLRGMVAVPLLFKEDALGVLTCYTSQPHEAGELEQTRLRALASLAAIDHHSSYHFRKWQAIELASKRLNQVRDVKTAVNQIANDILDIAEAVSATLCVYHAAHHAFLPEFARHVGQPGDWLPDWDNLSAGWQALTGKLLRQEKLLITNVATAEDILGSSLQQQLQQAGIRACIGLRLDGEEDPVGVLFAFYRNLHPYANPGEQHEAETPLNIYSGQAAAALGRAKYFTRRELEQEFIRHFTQKVSVMPTRQDVDEPTWQATLEELAHITGAERARLLLVDQWGYLEYAWPPTLPVGYLADQLALGERSSEWRVLHDKASYELQRDLPHDPHWGKIDNPALGSTHSKLVVPIFHSHAQACLGLISLESDHTDIFDLLDLQLTQDFAAHIGIDIGAEEGETSGRYRIRQLEQFIGESQNFTAIQLVRDKLAQQLETLRQTGGYDLVSLHMYDPFWDKFEPPLVQGQFLAQDENVYASLEALTFRPQQDAFFTSEPRLRRFVLGSFVESEGIRSSAMLRIRDEQQVVGLLFVYSRQAHYFEDKERRWLREQAAAMRDVILSSNFLRELVAQLREALDVDLVRLHLMRQEEDGVTMWSRPVSSGQLQVPVSWPPQTKVEGAIARVLLHPANSYFTPNAQRDALFAGSFVVREGVQAAGFVRLQVENEPLGVLFVNRRRAGRWKQVEIDAVRSFALIASVAVQNRRQLTQFKKKQFRLATIQKATEGIVMAGLDLTAVANIILTKAVTLTRASFATLRLVKGDVLEAEAVWGLSKEEEKRWRRENGRLRLDGPGLGPFLVNQATQPDGQNFVLVPDVAEHSHYLNTSGQAVQSSLVVLLRDVQDNLKAIGVLSVDHPDRNGLDDTDKDMLMLLANIAAVALKHASRRAIVETTETVALQGLFGANWWHTAHQKSFAIKQRVLLLEGYLRQGQALWQQEIAACLAEIEQAAEQIDQIPTRGVLPGYLEAPPELTAVDPLLQEMIARLCQNVPDVELEFDLHSKGAMVAVHPMLFELALEKLVTNAIEAMDRHGRLQIHSEVRRGNIVLIQLGDNGPGLPPEVVNSYLRERISRPTNQKGQGIGGMLARVIINRYGGHLRLEHSSPSGVTLTISLPLAKR
ncbi:MAG: GAF domain-containing protein [Chloroflexota bacterium]